MFGVPTGYSVSLTVNEVAIRDDVLLAPLIYAMNNGFSPEYSFQGKLRRRTGEEERIVYRNCLSDGSVDLQHLTPGDIIRRAWTFRCNSSPDLLTHFNRVQSLASDIYGALRGVDQ